jgi:hypothetical protein
MYGVNVKELLYSILINSSQQQKTEHVESNKIEKTV